MNSRVIGKSPLVLFFFFSCFLLYHLPRSLRPSLSRSSVFKHSYLPYRFFKGKLDSFVEYSHANFPPVINIIHECIGINFYVLLPRKTLNQFLASAMDIWGNTYRVLPSIVSITNSPTLNKKLRVSRFLWNVASNWRTKLTKLFTVTRNYTHAELPASPERGNLQTSVWRTYKSTKMVYNDPRKLLQELYVSSRIRREMLSENSWWSMRRITRP